MVIRPLLNTSTKLFGVVYMNLKLYTMRYSLIFLFILALSLSACGSGDESGEGALSSILPSSTGAADEVMFVIPDNLNTDDTKSVINQSFNKLYRILPKEESIFTISKVDFSAVNSLMYRFRNIVLLANTSESGEVLAKAKDILSPEQFEALEAGKQTTFILKNIWSKPQNVIFIFGSSDEALKENIAASAPQIIKHIQQTDLLAHKKIAYLNGVNVKLKEQLEEYYNIEWDLPSDFKMAENEGSFISFRKDVPKGMIFIYFDVVQYSDKVPDANYGIVLRNERGKYVSSNAENSYMSTDSTLGFIETRTEKDGLIIYETSGLWRMENDFMGGPFINQYIIDNDNNRVILLDGFMFAPGEDKKKRYMRQLEGIFSTLEVK